MSDDSFEGWAYDSYDGEWKLGGRYVFDDGKGRLYVGFTRHDEDTGNTTSHSVRVPFAVLRAAMARADEEAKS